MDETPYSIGLFPLSGPLPKKEKEREDMKRKSQRQTERQQVVQRHHNVSGSLALLLLYSKVQMGCRVVAPIGDKVL